MFKNKIAIRTNCYKGFDKRETFEGIRSAGFSYVELAANPNCNIEIDRFMGFSELAQRRSQLEKMGIKPICLSGHTTIMEEELTDDFLHNLALTRFFGCQYFDSYIGPRKDYEEEEIVKRLQFFVPYLKKEGVILGIETMGQYALGADLKRVIQKVNSEYIKMNYDFANVMIHKNVDNKAMLMDFEECIDVVGFAHLKDRKVVEGQLSFPVIGLGEVDFERVFELLKEKHNDCPLIVEIEFAGDSPKDVSIIDAMAKDSVDYLKKNGFEI